MSCLLAPSAYVNVGDLIYRVCLPSDSHKSHNFHKFLLLVKFPSCSLFHVLTLPTLFAPLFSSIPHRLDISTSLYGISLCHYPLLKFACSRGDACLYVCFDMILRCPFSLSAASVGILCKTGQRHWGMRWVTKGWVALDPVRRIGRAALKGNARRGRGPLMSIRHQPQEPAI